MDATVNEREGDGEKKKDSHNKYWKFQFEMLYSKRYSSIHHVSNTMNVPIYEVEDDYDDYDDDDDKPIIHMYICIHNVKLELKTRVALGFKACCWDLKTIKTLEKGMLNRQVS